MPLINRKETTSLLTDVLILNRLNDRKYYAKEVTLDYGTTHPKRVDVMEFSPNGVVFTSDIEKGIFICYEIKSCKEDIYSGNGLNFYGEENYIVTTMKTWKDIQEDYRSGVLQAYIKNHYPESSLKFGILVAVPSDMDLRNSNSVFSEFEKPSKFQGNAENWKLWKAIPCHQGGRNRSTAELLFCMLRSKHSYINQNK